MPIRMYIVIKPFNLLTNFINDSFEISENQIQRLRTLFLSHS